MVFCMGQLCWAKMDAWNRQFAFCGKRAWAVFEDLRSGHGLVSLALDANQEPQVLRSMLTASGNVKEM
jgi:hypothetical protein